MHSFPTQKNNFHILRHNHHTNAGIRSHAEAPIKSPKIRGGGNFEFPGASEIDPFYRDSVENCQFGGQKSKSSRGNFWGQSFGTF